MNARRFQPGQAAATRGETPARRPGDPGVLSVMATQGETEEGRLVHTGEFPTPAAGKTSCQHGANRAAAAAAGGPHIRGTVAVSPTPTGQGARRPLILIACQATHISKEHKGAATSSQVFILNPYALRSSIKLSPQPQTKRSGKHNVLLFPQRVASREHRSKVMQADRGVGIGFCGIVHYNCSGE